MARRQPTTPMPSQNEDEVAITEADLVALSDEVRRTGGRIIVTRDGAPDLVILGAAAYEDLMEGLEVAQALLQGEADFAAGRTHTHADAMAYAKARVEAARKDREAERRAG